MSTTDHHPVRRPSRARRPVLLALGAVLIAAMPAREASAADEAALLKRIETHIGSAACRRDDQCRTLPIGHKACGGPASWLAWSTTGGQGKRLKTLSRNLARAAEARQRREGRMSTCIVVPDPGARCEAGHCVLKAGGEAPPMAR